jgi:N-(2-amino-2-carboxyethyl)-L-glutamate synthase
VAIAPDLGERYLDTVYQPDWVQEFYPGSALAPDEQAAASGGADARDRTTPRPSRLSRRFRRTGTAASISAADREGHRYGGALR